MIIKIKSKDGWFIESDISKVTYSNEKTTVENECNWLKLDREEHWRTMEFIEKYESVYPKQFRSIRFEDSKQREIEVYFDSIAYLCNDSGKTIETLVVKL